jgi:dinuclear metal center YbgI/SA1388 family protein
MRRDELVHYLDDYLRIAEIRDYGPQGLQVEGREEVNVIVGAVDAHQPCLDAALLHEADLLLVHHGIFWGSTQKIAGSFGRLVRSYITSDVNLYAAHLALDGHPEVGNNVELARRLGLEVVDWWGEVQGTRIGVVATAGDGIKFDYLQARFEQSVGSPVLVQPFGPRVCDRVAIVSGGGAPFIEQAAALRCDTIVTGETSHAHFYSASNCGCNVIYGGHYTSETVGVQALGAHLADKFGIDFHFVDLPTGI